MRPPLYGLLLAGGKSTRMGRDKASLVVGGDGLTQAQRAVGLLRNVCERTCVSLRAGQVVPDGLEGASAVFDSPLAEGPLSGILAAFEEHPDAAWLVLACDLPFVTEEVLELLLGHRCADGSAPFLAFSSSRDGLPEPLCAIYEPSAAPLLQAHAARGHFCPRHIMVDEQATLLALPEGASTALANINTPADLEEVAGPMVHVSWFGRLSALRGVPEETVFTKAGTLGVFFEEMVRRHRIEVDQAGIRFAVNDEFADSGHALRNGDKVAFMPPFCGG